jgi:multicomponent Na+:H+ antiporter subunit D
MAALLTFGSRLVSILLAGSALAAIRHRATSLHFDDLAGVGTQLPLSMLAFALGALAMLGVPLTAGFPGHWAVMRLMAGEQTPWLWALLAASIVGSVGFLRAFAVMVTPAEKARGELIEAEPRIATAFLFALGVLSVLLALAPGIAGPVLTHILGFQPF